MALRTYGTMQVDWEQRADLDRLRRERLARAKTHLKESELGALLCFDMNNIRYITATHIGTWAIDKLVRFCLLPQNDEPIMWDFGSAARHHKLYNPWLGDERSRAGISTLRGSVKGRAESVAEKIRTELEHRGLLGEPVGIDIVELPVLEALQAEGIRVVDGQALLQDVRKLKTEDEIGLLNTACAMVDAAYDELFRTMRPGFRENDCVALVSKVLYELGSEHVEGVNAISGERCSPHPHVFTDRMLRPGDPAYFDILHAYNGYRTCYYRTFAVGSASRAQVDAYRRCRDYLDQGLALIRPGVTTAEVVSLWPEAEEFGFPDEEAAFALQYGHGVGLSIWEKPIFSRLVSFDYPETIQEGMVFALETFWPASDGWSAARIEEQLVVTGDGCEVITRFPAEELLVAGGGGPAPGGVATASPTESPAESRPRRPLASPKARRLAQERGVDLDSVTGSGPHGSVLAADLEQAGGDGVGALDTGPVWQRMAERVAKSWQSVPHFFLVREVDADRLEGWRETARRRAGCEKLTHSDLLVRICAAALLEHPRVNATWRDGTVTAREEINIGLAVATDAGLVVPVIQGADGLDLPAIVARRRELVEAARTGRLAPADVQGGTFTVSNLGMYGVDAFLAVVNAPQAAILAVGRIADRVVAVDGAPAVRLAMTLSLSFDHRVVDGARGAQFLDTLAALVEEPAGLVQ